MSNDDINRYVKEATKYKVLSHSEERSLLTKAKFESDDRAWDKLIKHNIKLVISIAKKYTNRGLTFEDLIQEGLIGLVVGINKFDMEKTNDEGKPLKLSTYATNWIKQRITREIANTSRTIRIPVHVLNDYPMVQRLYGKFREEWGVYPSTDELTILYNKATELDLKKKLKPKTPEEISELGRLFRPTSSLDEISSDDENLTMMDYVGAEYKEQPEMSLELRENKKYLTNLLNQLTPEEKAFITLKYGLVDGKERDRKSMLAYRRMLSEDLIKREEDIFEKLRKISNKEKVNLD